MSRQNRQKNHILRSQIANVAARMMLIDGIENVRLAKIKAGKELGWTNTKNLPTNDEVEIAMRDYQAIYMPIQNSSLLNKLTNHAFKSFSYFKDFSPFLTGQLLRGIITKNPVTELLLFCANPKDLVLFLINQQVEYDLQSKLFWVNKTRFRLPVYNIEIFEMQTSIIVLEEHLIHARISHTRDGSMLIKVRPKNVEILKQIVLSTTTRCS